MRMGRMQRERIGDKNQRRMVARSVRTYLLASVVAAILLVVQVSQLDEIKMMTRYSAVSVSNEQLSNLPNPIPTNIEATALANTEPASFEQTTMSSLSSSKPLTFHMIHTTNDESFRLMTFRSIESVFYHHPNAKVILHVKNMTSQPVQPILDAGYNLVVEDYNPKSKLRELIRQHVGGHRSKELFPNEKNVIQQFIKKIDSFAADARGFWYSNESNLMRMLLCYIDGGVYLDTDTIVVKPLTDLPWNTLGYQDAESLNGAILKFQQGHPYLEACLTEWFSTFKNRIWGMNGPHLLTRVYEEWKLQNPNSESVHVLKPEAFYYFHWRTIIKECFEDTDADRVRKRLEEIRDRSYVIHLNNQKAGNTAMTTDSACHCLLNSYCVASGSEPCKSSETCSTIFGTSSQSM